MSLMRAVWTVSFFLVFTYVDAITINAEIAGTSKENADEIRFELIDADGSQSPMKRNFRSSYEKFNTYLKAGFARTVILSSRIGIIDINKKLNNLTFQTAEKNFDLSIDILNYMNTIYGGYLLLSSIGTPQQKQYLYYDTGSSLTWVQCQGCSNCYNQPNPLYSYTSSSSVRVIPCNSDYQCGLPGVGTYCDTSGYCFFSESYGDGTSVGGPLMTETFGLSPFSITNTLFGCTILWDGASNSADGLAGFSLGTASFPSQYQNILGRNAFSSCLVRNPLNKTSKLIVGPNAISPTKVVYTPLVKNPYLSTDYFYYIQVTGVSVGGTKLKIPSTAWNIDNKGAGGTIFDSGTTLTYITRPAFNLIVKAIRNKTTNKLKEVKTLSGFSPCYRLTLKNQLDSLKYFPTITFFFKGGLKMNLLGYNYVDQISINTVCSLFQPSADLNILGNILQQNFLIIHDATGKQVGVKPMDCASGKPR